MFSEAIVGDKVFDYIRQGWGDIVEVDFEGVYPIKVEFKQNLIYTYTLNGCAYDTNKAPTLFWDEVKPITPPQKPLPDLDIDTRVIVWEIEGTNFKRHFSHFNKVGKIVCFDDGFTSWTGESTTSWSNWKLVDE